MSEKIVQPKCEGKIIELDTILEYRDGQVLYRRWLQIKCQLH